MLSVFTNVVLRGWSRPLLSMVNLGWLNWDIIPEVVLYHGCLEIRMHVIPLYLGIDHQLEESVLSLKSITILEGHGISLLSVKILRWYRSIFLFRDSIWFHHHVVWFSSIVNHNVFNSANTSNGETRSNYVEGCGTVVLIRSYKVLLEWCVHVWDTGIKI